MNRRASIAAALFFLALPLAAQTAPAPAPAPASDAPKPAGIDATVNAIQTLENVRDPKCDATATRLENFMYGTPLSTEAREKKVELQKKLIIGVWKEASDQARAKNLAAIPADIVQPLIYKAFPFKIDDAKNAHVTLGDGSELLLAERDVRQYSTVAYALRAILATQQDALLTPDVKLVPLAPEAVTAMKQMVDVYTLAALNLADKAARKGGEHQLSAKTLASQWARIATVTAVAQTATVLKPAAAKTGEPGEVLRKIIAQKLVSFATYNSNANPLLYSNIQTFYARYPWPADDAQIADITKTFAGGVMDFIAETIVRAERKAKAEGSPVVREKHVREVFDEFAPYSVNVYEDVIFFDRLPKNKQIYIEAYDADSLRDSGLHWAFIKQVIESPSFPLSLDFDPFAAELLAEGDAQMGVLLFRVAGQIAKEQNAPTLTAEHVDLARKRIAERFAEQLKAPAPSKAPAAKLASSSQKTKIPANKFFEDATDRVGIDFSHYSADWLARYQRSFLYSLNAAKNPNAPPQQTTTTDMPPAFSGSGVAAEDVNGDGIADILLVGGRGNALYLGSADGHFTDVTEKSGLNWIGSDGHPGEPRQPMIVDLDNDGRNDIVITYVNAPHRVWKNMGDGTFKDMTDVAKLGGENLVGGPAVAFDFDRDGLLDLYIGYYGDYLHGVGPNLARVNTNGTPNKLFRNMGNFQFKDVSAGSNTENDGWTQAVASIDFDRDGWPDLIVGNDFGKNAYYRNLGNGKFEDVSSQLGTDLPSSSMNVGSADLNKDGYPDIYISNIVGMVKDEKYVMPTETTKMKRLPEKLATMRVFENNHLFTSTSPFEKGKLPKYALNEAVDPMDTSTGWAWDADFFDFDNDGDDDLYVVNGLNEYRIYADTFKQQTPEGERTIQFAVHEKEPNVFFVNENGRLINRSAGSGADFSGNSRSAAYLDIDNDGDLDIIVNNYDSKATFLINNSQSLKNNWLKVKLVGDPAKQTNPQAIGATIVATTPSGNKIWREVQAATGYLSQHPSQQHFGLGKDTEADLLIIWPNGETKEVKHVKAGKLTTIKQ